MDPQLVDVPEKYDALRAYDENLGDRVAKLFKNVYASEYMRGAGRWACARRLLATLAAKIPSGKAAR